MGSDWAHRWSNHPCPGAENIEPVIENTGGPSKPGKRAPTKKSQRYESEIGFWMTVRGITVSRRVTLRLDIDEQTKHTIDVSRPSGSGACSFPRLFYV